MITSQEEHGEQVAKKKLATFSGERMKRLRESAGMTQQKLAIAVELSEGHIGNLESGRTEEPGANLVSKIAATLGVGIEELFE